MMTTVQTLRIRLNRLKRFLSEEQSNMVLGSEIYIEGLNEEIVKVEAELKNYGDIPVMTGFYFEEEIE